MGHTGGIADLQAAARARLAKVLRNSARPRGVDLAACGARTYDLPEIDPHKGCLVGGSIYSKPPVWLLHLTTRQGRLELSMPPHEQARRLGYLNARAGRHVAGLVFRVVIARHEPNGWHLMPDAEWSLVFLRAEPIAAGTSSETVDNFNPETGTFEYQGRPCEYDFAGLVGILPATHVVIAGQAPITYAELGQVLANFIHVRTRSEGGVLSVPLYEASTSSATLQLQRALGAVSWPDRSRQSVGAAPAIEDIVGRHNDDVRRKVLYSIGNLTDDEFDRFIVRLLALDGFDNGRVSSIEVGGVAVKHATGLTREGGVYVRFEAIFDRRNGEVRSQDVRDWMAHIGNAKRQVLVSTGTFSAGSISEAPHVRYIDGDAVARLCERGGLGITTRQCVVLGLNLSSLT
jgi:hypothetical protein